MASSSRSKQSTYGLACERPCSVYTPSSCRPGLKMSTYAILMCWSTVCGFPCLVDEARAIASRRYACACARRVLSRQCCTTRHNNTCYSGLGLRTSSAELQSSFIICGALRRTCVCAAVRGYGVGTTNASARPETIKEAVSIFCGECFRPSESA